MDTPHLAYFLALGATLCFSSSSIVFSEYTKRFGTLWMNALKALVALTFCLITFRFFGPLDGLTLPSALSFLASGLIGLCIGDLFLLVAFTQLGVARSIMLFGFQPLIIGVASIFIFGQSFDPQKLLALVFLLACLFTFAWEGHKKEKNWKIKGLLFALTGVVLDAMGVLLTRYGYDHSAEIAPVHGHLMRSLGAVGGFLVISFFTPLNLTQNLKKLTRRELLLVLGASFAGTFLSLFLYLSAVRIGHLASISGIAVTGPMFAALIECVWKKKWPSRYLIIAFGCFVAGFLILI